MLAAGLLAMLIGTPLVGYCFEPDQSLLSALAVLTALPLNAVDGRERDGILAQFYASPRARQVFA